MPADQRALDDIGRIEPAAEAHLEDAGVGGRAREGEEGGGGRDLEEARLDAAAASSTSASKLGEQLVLDQRPAMRMRSLKRTRCGLVKAWTVWPAASSAARRKATGRAFAVGAGDMEDGRQAVLRAAEQRSSTIQPDAAPRPRRSRWPGGRASKRPVELRLDARDGSERREVAPSARPSYAALRRQR